MTTERQVQFVSGVFAWKLAILLLLVVTGWFSYELFFVTALVGFLIVAELTSPVYIRPEWRRRLRWIILLGIGVFLIILSSRTMAALPEVF